MVADDSRPYLVSSPRESICLQNRYTFWYYRKGARKKDRDPSGAYESGIKVVESFQTVEHFWRIYNHIVRADEVMVKGGVRS